MLFREQDKSNDALNVQLCPEEVIQKLTLVCHTVQCIYCITCLHSLYCTNPNLRMMILLGLAYSLGCICSAILFLSYRYGLAHILQNYENPPNQSMENGFGMLANTIYLQKKINFRFILQALKKFRCLSSFFFRFFK